MFFDLTSDSKEQENFHKFYQPISGCHLDEYSSLIDENFRNIESELVRSAVDELRNIYSKAERLFKDKAIGRVPDLYLFKGPGSQDGHSLLYQGKAIAYLDLSLTLKHYQNKNFEKLTHLIHEMSHGIFYEANPETYKNILNQSQRSFFCNIVSEGVATYLRLFTVSGGMRSVKVESIN